MNDDTEPIGISTRKGIDPLNRNSHTGNWRLGHRVHPTMRGNASTAASETHKALLYKSPAQRAWRPVSLSCGAISAVGSGIIPHLGCKQPAKPESYV